MTHTCGGYALMATGSNPISTLYPTPSLPIPTPPSYPHFSFNITQRMKTLAWETWLFIRGFFFITRFLSLPLLLSPVLPLTLSCRYCLLLSLFLSTAQASVRCEFYSSFKVKTVSLVTTYTPIRPNIAVNQSVNLCFTLLLITQTPA